jgi:hypothetical protein
LVSTIETSEPKKTFFFQIQLNEYEMLLQMMTSFFKNFLSLESSMKNLTEQQSKSSMPKDIVSLCFPIGTGVLGDFENNSYGMGAGVMRGATC